jgi:two-component system phosphate regulon response regulator PhoB
MRFRVLLIDDEESLCETLKYGLEATGRFEVGFATDGQNGTAHGPQRFSGRHSPRRLHAGYERTRRAPHAQGEYPLSEIPVIMFSGLQDEATKMECNYLYGEEYVEKPISLAALQNRLEAVLRRIGKLAPLPAAAIP